uniref:Angiotensin-converting enzyme n=1 Tax=Anoplophora glabripennis TaxID=217634 RepID=V5GKK7_ANOGL
MEPNVNLWTYLFVLCNCFVWGSFSSEKLMAELQLADMELADACNELSKALRSGVLHGDFNEKIAADKAYGSLLTEETKNLKEYEYIPQEIERNYTFLLKPGDGLLPEEEWNMLVSYHNDNEEIESIVKVPCSNNTEGCLFTKGEYQNILRTSRDVDLLNSTWFSWQHVFGASSVEYSTVLELTKKAASLNEFEDVASYWEYLNDFSGAYAKAREFWEEIKPLYLKLHRFVRTRLNNYYKINETVEIPVFLLGSNFGNDWSYIADIILPHPQLHYDVETFLKYKSLREVYILAENLTHATSLGTLGEKFWNNSRFNMTYCEPHIFSFCADEYSEVYDCDEPSWVTYLDAHETAFRIALRNQDYSSLMRQNLRYSGVDEAIAALGPLFAIESMHYHGIKTVADVTDESVKMTKLLLVALRFLPQLPYYLAADEWRLQELDVPSANVAAYWWKVRNEYQGIKSVSGAERDFLRDEYITSNKPYIRWVIRSVVLLFEII